MGCTTTTPEARKMLKVPTLFGALHISVLNCHLDHTTNLFMAMDPYVKILISNQPKSTQVKLKGGFDPRFDEDFVYIINSCYKPYGRSLELFVLDKHSVGNDQLIGYGLVDLDFLIKGGKQTNDVKVRLNYKCKQIGWANLKVRFEELPKESINFRMETVQSLKHSFQGCKHCFVKMTVGEQIFQTPKVKDTPQISPVWNDQGYQFEIPSCINVALFEVFDDKKLIGKVECEIGQFAKLGRQTNFKLQIKDTDGQVTGMLKFSAVKGDNIDFEPDQAIYKKMIETNEPKRIQKKDRKKKDDYKVEEEKKESEKPEKPQPQQNEPKTQQAPKIEEIPMAEPEKPEQIKQ